MKQIRISEEDLHNIIKNKIMEAVEGMTDLGYAPVIGNKKAGPSRRSSAQMEKRRNKKLDEAMGPHDESQIYDELYSAIEDRLDEWGASPVYGWRGDKGIAFSVRGKKWITVVPSGFNGYYYDDSLLVTFSDYGADNEEDAIDSRNGVYLGELGDAIDDIIRSNS